MAKEDTFWKAVLDNFFPEFMEFSFPKFYAEIDWNQSYETLDKELEKLTQETAENTGKRLVDKLVKVMLRNGEETWLLIHLEVQGYPDKTFAERMYIYNYRIFDRYKKPVISLALLTSQVTENIPTKFEFILHDFKHTFEFPAIKIWKYKSRIAELEENNNPFALIVLGFIKNLTEKEAGKKRDAKVAVVRLLLRRGYSKNEIIKLFRFVDWVITLPPDLQLEFEQKVAEIEGKKMEELISPFEQRILTRELEKGLQQGREQGLQQGREQGLQQGREQGKQLGFALTATRLLRRFLGEIPHELELTIFELPVEKLGDLVETLLDFKTVENLENWLKDNAPITSPANEADSSS